MELNVNIDPEQINKLVADAVLQSAIGVQVKRIVDEAVKNLSRSYDNPIEAVVKEEIRRLVTQTLMNDHATDLKAKVVAAVSEKLTSEFVVKIIDSGLRNY